MQSPEQFVLLVNATVLGCAYFLVYPRFAGADLGRLAMNDLIASGISLLMEFPLFFWYARRHKVFERTGDGS